MNKQELELVNLIDVAFVAQDYETAINNGKFPFTDFKNCKAFRHAASCQEIMFLSSVAFDSSFLSGANGKELDSMIESTYSLF